VQSSSLELVQLLLGDSASPTHLDSEGSSPLVLYLEGTNCKKCLYNTLLGTYDPIFGLLTSKGADTNVVYRERTLVPEYGREYKCTLLINFIR
jgi:hypothetical protein